MLAHRVVPLLFFIFFNNSIAAQQNRKSASEKKIKNISFIPFPAVSFSPETKWLYGAGAASTFRLHPKDTAERPSSANGGVAFTQNNQVLLFTQFAIFNKNKNYFFGELGYFKFSFFYYGVGKNEVPEELYKVRFPRIKLNATKRVNKLMYLGGGLQYENFNITEVKSNGALEKNNIVGANGSTVAGIGLVSIVDSRDVIFFPTKGIFGNFSIYNYGNHFGGNVNYTKLTTDLAFYKKLTKKHILATQWYNSFAVGKVPFQQLGQLGGPKLMRGYYQGRFIDKNISLLQTEARLKIYNRFSAAIFASTGILGNQKDFLRVNDAKYAYGIGTRFTFNRKENLNIRLDYAKGKDKGFFYFTIGEAF